MLGGHVASSVELIKIIDRNGFEAQAVNLKALLANVGSCFEVLSKTLELTADIISIWLDKSSDVLVPDSNFLHFFAMTMRAKNNKVWFNSYDRGNINVQKEINVCR